MNRCTQNLLITFNVLFGTAWIVSYPLFIDSFPSKPNAYFVVIFNLIVQVIITGILNIRDTRELFFQSCDRHFEYMMIGFFWTLSFLTTSLTSSEGRTPVDVQSVLLMAIVPMTALFSKLNPEIKNNEAPSQNIISVLIFLGILVSCIPTIISMGNNSYSKTEVISICIFYFGIIISAGSNVVTEVHLKKHNTKIIHFNFWVNLYQLIFSGLMFSVNFFPVIGTSSNRESWTQDMRNSWSDFTSAKSVVLPVIISSIASVGAFMTDQLITKRLSANFNMYMLPIKITLAFTYWIIFPHGNKVDTFTIVMNYIGIIIIFAALHYFGNDTQSKKGVDKYVQIDNDSLEQIEVIVSNARVEIENSDNIIDKFLLSQV
jgi:hypothetical protein